MKLSWSHAFVPTENLNEMVDFYIEMLDFKVTDRIDYEKDGEGIVFLSQDRDAEHHQLAFASTKDLPRKSTSAHFAFRTESLDDVKALIHKLRRLNSSQSPRTISHGNTWSVYFQDPDSNGIEVFCDTPWIVNQPCSIEWTPEDDNKTIFAKTKAAIERRPDFATNPRY